MSEARIDRRGLWMAAASFVLWGVMPLYWHLLKSVPSLQIIVHRIVWSAIFVATWLGWKYGRGWLRETLAQPRAAWMLALSGTLIPEADNAELKALLETGLSLFQSHQAHAEHLAGSVH